MQAQAGGLVDISSREMIESILEFTHTVAREIMIPRTEIIAVSTEADVDEILGEVIASGHTRIPVYRETIDNIIGILNVKDILKFLPEKSPGKIFWPRSAFLIIYRKPKTPICCFTS